jgi:HEAT repeat protein
MAALPDDERFLVGLLENEYANIGGEGDLFVLAAILGTIVDRGVREDLPLLHQMLVDPRTAALHEDIAEALGEMGDNTSVPYLIRALSSGEVWVRAKSARSLAKLGDPQAIRPLILLLDDDSDTVRENAIKALVELGAIGASDALIRLAAFDESSEVRSQAVKALGRLRIQEAIPHLRKLRDEENDEDVIEAIKDTLAALDSEFHTNPQADKRDSST